MRIYNIGATHDTTRTSLLWDGHPTQIFPKRSVFGTLLPGIDIPETVDLTDWPLHPGSLFFAEANVLNEYFTAALSE